MTVMLGNGKELEVVTGGHLYCSENSQKGFFINWDELSDSQQKHLKALEAEITDLVNNEIQQHKCTP